MSEPHPEFKHNRAVPLAIALRIAACDCQCCCTAVTASAVASHRLAWGNRSSMARSPLALSNSLFARFLALAKSKMGRLYAGTFVMAVVTRLAALGMAVLLARQLGPAGYGQFAFALNAAALAAHFSGLGLPMLANKLFPQLQVQEQWAELKGFGRASEWITLGTSLVVASVLYGASFLSGMSAEIATGLALSAILVVPTALRMLRRRQLASIRRPATGLFIDEGFAPTFLIISLLVVGTLGLAFDLILFGLASLVAAIVGSVLIRRALPDQVKAPGLTPHYAVGAWLGAALPMMLGTSSRLILNRTDVLLLAPLSSMEQVGYFGAAMRLTYVLTFPQMILNTVVGPTLSEAYAAGKYDLLKRRFFGAMLFAAVTAVPVALVIWWLREPLIQFIFGAAFAPAADILAVLVVGQVAVALGLPCSFLLMMTGHERAFATASLLSLALNAGLGIYLIPQYGGEGAAVALGISSALLLSMQLFLTWRALAGFTKRQAEG